MNAQAHPVNPVAALLHLEQRAQEARSTEQLGFVIVNETWQLLQYRQGYFFVSDVLGKPALSNVSSLATLAEESPFTVWLKGLAHHLWSAPMAADDPAVASVPSLWQAQSLPDSFAEGWAEWMPAHLLCIQLPGRDHSRRGMLLLACDTEPDEHTQALLARLSQTYAYCLAALTNKRPTLGARWQVWRRRPLRMAGLACAVALAFLFPVRLSALAPAEIEAHNAMAIAAPQDGVVHEFLVQPNQLVQKDQPLFSLDDTTLRNRRAVALQALQVARSEALLAAQKAFDNAQSKGELAALNGQVQEKQAEVAWLDEMLERNVVRAPREGIAIFGDSNDWIGKPVVTGERIIQLADPQDAGVLVWLPVANAINLDTGSQIRLFLHVPPLSPLTAHLIQTSYQATLSPDNVPSYRIRGQFQGDVSQLARIGLKGTAKLYGEPVPLIYYVLRRPLAALREWSGL
ncbi:MULTISPECIES: efflux RND transporter periplasmic adaptor subunit [unclassified Pseudomonas]|uniref:efflux RND transporter periplasmic adaptor subunit n=1 Tax=unclassified Pseudomonas TaxID=196821 RepID=UPI00119ED5C9|nr:MULTISPECIES: biotin/lipoyl-binding protein [unclassified Pseudomonas]TWC13381.1 multidrug efflux pump subunit AcrA (membrane-fusion protein) [Pseudomonas sp. SJZ075]TWC29679.1 multidrug efflux pump subunit AcrA (membrane-fusion protein) [Pseudomonas sp. SJZ078]TWC50365.1 multidrug efflux pump subunit AcrA (membrane-fusion protein) [Pseudomonas sp. SJZ124]TWC86135.1 multidrug efflux pump subunit AcrA (membrane-fusion protein) [Pseudomonas sp. SJZ101]